MSVLRKTAFESFYGCENPYEDLCNTYELSIEVYDKKFTNKLFNKRNAFPQFLGRMPYLDSNIPTKIFNGP